jgi:LCP family protein required for cell wall assembly
LYYTPSKRGSETDIPAASEPIPVTTTNTDSDSAAAIVAPLRDGPSGHASGMGDQPVDAAIEADAASTVDRANISEAPANLPSGRRALLAALLSFLWPGLGQLALGRRRAALLFALPGGAFVAWFILQLDQGPAFFALNLWDDSYLMTVFAVVLAFGVWRIAAVLHTLLVGIKGRRWRVAESAVAAGLVIAILAMHVGAVSGAWIWYDASVQINQNDMFAEASPTPAPTRTLAPTASPKPQYSFPTNGLAAPSNPYPASSPTPAPNPNRITFLLIGVDFMDGRAHSLTDSLMVVSADVKTRKVALVSVPRDTAGFQLYYGPWVGYNFKINTLLNSVDNGKLKSPDSGIATLEKEIGFLVGIPIDYYAAIDIDGFVKMVDAAGGVDVVNKHDINDPPFLILPAGPAHLDGDTAMRYVRSREHGGSDYLRAQRQQEVLKALEKTITSTAMVPQLPTLLSLAGQNISTNFPLKSAKNYVKLGQHLAGVDGCVLGPPYSWHPATSSTGGLWTSQLDLRRVAELSVSLFGHDSSYYGQVGVQPIPCQS